MFDSSILDDFFLLFLFIIFIIFFFFNQNDVAAQVNESRFTMDTTCYVANVLYYATQPQQYFAPDFSHYLLYRLRDQKWLDIN